MFVICWRGTVIHCLQAGVEMSEVHSFRLTDEDEDIEKILSKLKGKEKSNFIRKALRFYISFGQKLEEICCGVNTILKRLDNGILTATSSGKNAEEAEKNEELLLESVKDILNL